MLLFFTSLYFYPFHPRTSINYKLYFWFNQLLLADLVVRIILTMGYVLGFVVKKQKIKVFAFSSIVLSFAIVLIIISGSFFGRNHIQIRKIELGFEELPSAFNNLKIVQFSDFHIGGFTKKSKMIRNLERTISILNPDLIFFTGDLFNNFKEEAEEIDLKFIQNSAPLGTFAVTGNHDYGDYFDWKSTKDKAANFNAITDYYKITGFRLLLNENEKIKKGSDSLYIIGVENWGHPPFPQYADLPKALNGIPSTAFKLLLSHDPAHWENHIAGKEKIALTFSGHTHGLQWGLKFAGIELSLMKLIRNQWGGLYSKGENLLYVNRGFGTIGFPARIDMYPELTLITLRKK